ncbi:hypothetical protein Chor_011425, partial [Crotalus horridus]
AKVGAAFPGLPRWLALLSRGASGGEASLVPGLKMAFSRMKVPPALFSFLLLFQWMPNSGSSQQDTCQTCRGLVDNFNKGLERTQRENFGGGNTAWEEEKLAKYANSETRLLEVLESVCSTSDFACHQLLERSEDHVEHWWFHEQQQHPDFFQWLCMDTLKLCCPSGTYGPDCQTCPGGAEKPCSGYGQCDGEGTRGGTGLCMCQTGYGGPFCSECGDGYYEAARNDSHLVCAVVDCVPFHTILSPTQSATGPVGAVQALRIPAVYAAREAGCCTTNDASVSLWPWKEGSYECRDVDECAGEVEEPVCTGANEVCENTDGSYRYAPEKGFFDDITDDEVVVLQQMFFGAIICALATLAAKGDMVFTAIFIGAVAAMAGYWMSERSDRVLDGFMKGR